MPNGRGTPSCMECKHAYFNWKSTPGLPADAICKLWNVRLPMAEMLDNNLEYLIPPEEYKYDNLICKDYERNNEEVGWLLPEVVSQLDKGLLYAIAYNEIPIPSAYHRIVCRLSKAPHEELASKCWLEKNAEEFIGKRLLVTNVLLNIECGSYVRNALFKSFYANFIREDSDTTFFSKGRKIGKNPFHVRLLRFWDHQGKRYGGIAKIEEKKLWCNDFWVIFSINRTGTFNFTDHIGQFSIHIGPEEPVFWNGIWPRFEKGSPRFSGLVEIKADVK
ncbi:MAG: hypothetical protein OEV87_02500 [Phycisphaerae bacterium]|nr:hypothetical protein [Phycisphaerae bacterium]